GILADIVKADRRAGDVIQRLRAFLKRGESNRQAHEVNEIVEESLLLMRSDLIARGVTVECTLAPGLPSVRCDRVQIQQVILNLLMNACDAMAGNESCERQAKVSTVSGGGSVRISVRDAGRGLPPDIESLFQPFVTTKGQGLGLGLAISRSIMESHEGKLWAEPQSRGAAFHVDLPVPEGMA
ncbi:MAG: PAS domain-containing sensor histidine kinase, partial [Verrucomicrobiae bacterium]|nr:PAS domain-containing sensor histidine kinase [Verrucomicrobiae bacterium]